MTTKKFDPDSDPDSGEAPAWQPASRGRRREPGLVLSVRLTPELAEGLQALADSEKTTVSESARRVLSDALATMWTQTAITVRVTQNSATLTNGPTSVGGESKLRTAIDLGLVAH